MKKIVFFIQNFSRPAGSERVTSIIASGLANNGYDVTVLSICGDNTCFYTIDNKVKLFTLFDKAKVNNKFNFFKIYFKLKKFYKQNKVDIVIDVFASLSIFTLLLKNKFGFKNITWEHFNYKQNIGLNKYGRKLAVKKSDYIVTLTQRDKQFYLAANPKIKSQICYILNPCSFDRIEHDKYEKENTILSVGRLTWQKGFDIMLLAWKELERKLPNWTLKIIGAGEEKENLINLCNTLELKNIQLINATNNVQEYYYKSKIYLSTSRFEGLPMTMIEAQFFGLPIISFNYDTGPAEIINNNVNGYLVENGNVNELISCLVKFALDENAINQFSINARRASKRFEQTKIINEWLKLIEVI